MQDKLNNLLNKEEDGEMEEGGEDEDRQGKDFSGQGNKVDTVEEDGEGENQDEEMEEMEGMGEENEENVEEMDPDEYDDMAHSA